MKARKLQTLTVLAAAIVTLGVTGCHKKDSAPPPYAAPPTVSGGPAPSATITADPLAIDLGQSVVLNWRTQNATSVSIDGVGAVNVNGTQTVTPSNSTNFHLVARGDGGTAEANVRVTVRIPEVPRAPVGGNSEMGSEALFHQNVQDIFFGYDSYDIPAEASNSVATAASYLAANPQIRIVIGGYCDNRGSAEYNLALGENRANAAKSALVTAGVAANRIRVISYGKEKQFCSEETESCWQQNRRAQFSLDR